MYKTLENYSPTVAPLPSNCGHYPFITYQRDIAQQNRQLQALQANARQYSNDVARGNVKQYRMPKYIPQLDYKSKN